MRKDWWRTSMASPEAVIKIKQIDLFCKIAMAINYLFGLIAVIALQPLSAIDYNTTMHFFLYVTHEMSLPSYIFYPLAILNFTSTFLVLESILAYFGFVVYFSMSLKIQFVLVYDYIMQIDKEYEKISTEDLVDDETYQNVVFKMLCRSASQHIFLAK